MTLTQKDLDAIRDLVGVEIDERLERKLEEKLKSFPSKEEFFSRMDEVMGEFKTMREEVTVLSRRVSNHEDRITILDDKIGIQTP